MPKPVLAENEKYLRELSREADFAWMKWIRRREEVRLKVAKFLGAEPEEITFIQSTSQGMNHIADLIGGRGGALAPNAEFPSTTLPWLWRRVPVKFVADRNGVISSEAFRRNLSPQIKTILTSYVQYSTGFRQDLRALGKMKGGRFLVVNATQACGALDINLKKLPEVDFLCTNSYKWLMAGYGGGILFIRKKWLAQLKPGVVGWRSMKDPEAMNNRKLDLKPEASRYELGCPDFPAIFAVGAAVNYFTQIGMDRIEKRVLELAGYAADLLQENGFEVVSPLEKSMRSGIVVFRIQNPQQVWKKLLSEKIYVSPRGEGIRIAPHFYNTEAEIETAVKALVRHRKAGTS